MIIMNVYIIFMVESRELSVDSVDVVTIGMSVKYCVPAYDS